MVITLLCDVLLATAGKKKVRHFSRSWLFYEQAMTKRFIYVGADFGGNAGKKDTTRKI
jgi:hypothetical protein